MTNFSIVTAGRLFRSGALTPTALTERLLDRIAREDGRVNSFAAIFREAALRAADEATRELAQGRDRGPLHGIPCAVMDMIDAAGVPTLCASPLMPDVAAAEDAAIVARLRRAGAILLGKVATFEFATAPPDEGSSFAVARNPWDRERSAGASGAGAAIAAGFVPFSIAIDTGGAVRGSAASCGAVGLKPSFGRVSRRGAYPLAYSLDHCGPLAGTVEDAALCLQAIAGHDPRDPASVDQPAPDYRAGLARGVAGAVVGIDLSWCGNQVMTDAVTAALKVFEAAGARIEEVMLPAAELWAAASHTIYLAEAYAIHERNLVARPELYGRATRERLTAGAFVRGADYVNAQRVRQVISAELNDEILRRVDFLILPAAPGPAPRLEALRYATPGGSGGMTLPFNLTGNPALSLCCGFSAEGMPLGLQLVGRAFDEASLLGAASAYEAATPWHERRPPGFADGHVAGN